MKPIIMSTEDVRGILDGRKTMMRLAAKELDGVDILNCRHVGGDIQEPKGYPIGHVSLTERCKFKPGDVLWVRETWAKVGIHRYLYQADGPEVNAQKIRQHYEFYMSSERWMSPVTMPREAARLFLRVKDVWVERVQDVTADDAIKEGCTGIPCDQCAGGYFRGCTDCMNSGWREPPQLEFSKHWDSRNAKRGYGWDSNPWVWVIEFESTPSGAIGPEPDGTAPNGDKGATHE